MASPTIIIIGAGVAGLAAGCYGQMNGFQTQIYEMHDKPGGLCTAWGRKGYTFDGCIHHLAGAGSSSKYYPIWEELGVLPGLGMSFHDELVRMEEPGGKTLVVYTDLERLEKHLLELAPEDAPRIAEYVKGVRRFSRFELLALPFYSKSDFFKALPNLAALPRWMKVSLNDFASRFTNQFLKRALPHVQYDIPGVPMGVHLAFLAGCHNRTLGTPQKSSLEFARAMERRFLELGGEVVYRAMVKRILVENNRAVGVQLEDGSEHRAEGVISAADGRSTIFEMLEGRYTSEVIRAYYEHPPADPQPFSIHVSLGVARDLSGEPPAVCRLLKEPFFAAGTEHHRLNLELYGPPGFAPPGKGVIKAVLESTYEYWAELYRDRERYKDAKAQVVEALLPLLEERFPGLPGQVEAVDVATPVTTERFTANYHGLQAWGPPKGSMRVMFRGLSRTLPGLENFAMAGHWADAMIGISTAALSGRRAIRQFGGHKT